MSRFAGADPRKIHHLERDAEFLIELPKDVQILNIVDTKWRCCLITIECDRRITNALESRRD